MTSPSDQTPRTALDAAWDALADGIVMSERGDTWRAVIARYRPAIEAQARTEALDGLDEAIYAALWLTPDPKPRAASWRWLRAQVVARKVRAILTETER